GVRGWVGVRLITRVCDAGRGRVRVRGPRFFFSSRRRHTRFKCDWSSDVCSSDLMKKRFEVERREIKDSDVEVVLLSASSREALKRTHSRYFKTGEQLTADMAEALK